MKISPTIRLTELLQMSFQGNDQKEKTSPLPNHHHHHHPTMSLQCIFDVYYDVCIPPCICLHVLFIFLTRYLQPMAPEVQSPAPSAKTPTNPLLWGLALLLLPGDSISNVFYQIYSHSTSPITSSPKCSTLTFNPLVVLLLILSVAEMPRLLHITINCVTAN